MSTYHATTYAPPLVRRATELAVRMGFGNSCTPEVGRLLRCLAGGVQRGTIGEIGAGCGVGAAWIASALTPGARFVTVELDATRATATQELFTDLPNVNVIHGDWREILVNAPFDLLFADVTDAKHNDPGTVVDALRPGGLVLLDDLTPEEHWPPEWRGKPDPVREYWLNEPRLAATEILLTPRNAAMIATRLE